VSNDFATRGFVMLAAAMAASLSGCINPFAKPDDPPPFEAKEELVVMPDGSGKMTFTLVMLGERPTPKEELAAEAAEWLATPRYPPAFCRALFEGAVGFSPIRAEAIADGCIGLSYTVYFQDVSDFRFSGFLFNFGVVPLLDESARGEDAAALFAAQFPWTTFRYAKSGDGFALEVHDVDPGPPVKDPIIVTWALMLRYLGSPDSDWDVRIAPWKAPHWKTIAEAPIEGDDPDGSKAARKAFAERVLQGRRFEQTCTMPGDITEVSAWTSHEGRTASLTVMSKEIEGRFLPFKEGLEGRDKDAQAKLAAEMLEEYAVRKIECGPSSVPEESVAAFKKEFEQAKAEWDAHLEKQAMETAKRQAWSNAFTEAARLGRDREAVRRVLQPLVDKDPWRALREANRFGCNPRIASSCVV
jgi:hypothetical protein